MNEQVNINASLNTYFDAKEAFLDKFIDTGSDHELFVASYIHGHFSVVAAKTMQEIHAFSEAEQAIFYFTELLQTSIAKAINDGELSAQDAKDVTSMLGNIIEAKYRLNESTTI